MSTAPRRTRQKSRAGRYHHGDLRRVLLDAALALAAEGGAEAVSLREAARRAGVASSAPYHHFPDKLSLLAALAEEGYAALLRRLEAAARRSAGKPRAHRLEALTAAYFRFAMDERVFYQLMFLAAVADPARYPSLHERGQRCLEVIVGVLCDGVRRPNSGEALETAVLLWSTAHGFVSLWNADAFRFHPRFTRPASLPRRLAAKLGRFAAG